MIYIILPAYNEAKSLPLLIPKIKAVMEHHNYSYTVIIVNDGSKDDTSHLINEYKKQMPIEVINHKYNRGLGETIRDGFEYASEISTDDDIIIRLDCDDTHDPIYMPGLIDKINQGSDVVIASRFVEGGGQEGLTFFRKTISLFANLFMKIFFPIKGLKEYSSGYRAYRVSVIKHALEVFGNNFIQLKGIGFSCTLEKIIKLKILGAKFSESPFVLKYNQKLSESKMITSITIFGYLILVILYHWPWNGWKSQFRGITKLH
jgi:dolichol-phosphate mannosyltransferase